MLLHCTVHAAAITYNVFKWKGIQTFACRYFSQIGCTVHHSQNHKAHPGIFNDAIAFALTFRQ